MRNYIFISGYTLIEKDKDKDIFFINELKMKDKCNVLYFDINKYHGDTFIDACKKFFVSNVKGGKKYILICHGKGGFYGLHLCNLFSSYFTNIFLINSNEITDKVFQKEISEVNYFMEKYPEDKKIYLDLLKEIQFEWNKVPIKLNNNIKIYRITNIDILSKDHLFFSNNYKKDYIEQIYRLESIKEYNLLLKENNKYFNELFFLDSSYSIHYNEIEKILEYILKNVISK